jgi:hypothetical protein
MSRRKQLYILNIDDIIPIWSDINHIVDIFHVA